ncbi:MAG: hypothetical protein R2911_22810 [Caldilineaceae bacterium]
MWRGGAPADTGGGDASAPAAEAAAEPAAAEEAPASQEAAAGPVNPYIIDDSTPRFPEASF